MKVTMEREEILAMLAADLKAKLGVELKCIDSEYSTPRELTFADDIAIAAKAKADADYKAWCAENDGRRAALEHPVSEGHTA